MDKQIKEEIKQVVTNLGNIKFTVEDELEFCKQVLKRKEQECEELVSKGNQLDKKCKQQSWDIGNLGYKIKNQRHEINNRLKQLDQLKAENEILKEKITISSNSDKITLKIIKTLTEIKEIAEEYQKNYLINNGVVLLCNQILQKISAAENDHIVEVNNMMGECIPDEGKSSDHIPDVGKKVESEEKQ